MQQNWYTMLQYFTISQTKNASIAAFTRFVVMP